MATAVPNAVPEAVSPDWLTIDTTAAEAGFGPAVYGDPQEVTTPVVPTSPNPLPPDQPEYVSDSQEWQYDSEHAGAWPFLPDSAYQPVQRPDGEPQGEFETELPHANAKGMWNDSQPLQTYDRLSQHTDNAGWQVNVPNDRVSARNTFGQANPQNNPTWPPVAERPVRPHTAVRPTDLTTYPGEVGVAGYVSGDLPDWSATGGQGNTAYETPGPPAVSTASEAAPAGAVYSPESGWV